MFSGFKQGGNVFFLRIPRHAGLRNLKLSSLDKLRYGNFRFYFIPKCIQLAAVFSAFVSKNFDYVMMFFGLCFFEFNGKQAMTAFSFNTICINSIRDNKAIFEFLFQSAVLFR